MPRPSLLTVTAVILVAMLGFIAVAASRRATDQKPSQSQPQAERPQPITRTIIPDEPTAPSKPAPAPVKPAPKPAPTFAVAHIKPGRTVALHSKPGGRVVTRVTASTEFGSPSTLAVAERRGRWLGVTSTDLPNGKLAWVENKVSDFKAAKTHMSVRIDLSSRRLELRDGRKVVRRLSVGIGRAGSTTPRGRYAVTDKIPGTRYGSYYGCCILALSGHQTNTPAGWQGGDRLAIHGTSNPASIGVPSSAGCLHADTKSLRLMMRRVPLGTPVFIRA
jgi:lipoprotein-anchoring transpeptidase ErfK/SrfK